MLSPRDKIRYYAIEAKQRGVWVRISVTPAYDVHNVLNTMKDALNGTGWEEYEQRVKRLTKREYLRFCRSVHKDPAEICPVCNSAMDVHIEGGRRVTICTKCGEVDAKGIA